MRLGQAWDGLWRLDSDPSEGRKNVEGLRRPGLGMCWDTV